MTASIAPFITNQSNLLGKQIRLLVLEMFMAKFIERNQPAFARNLTLLLEKCYEQLNQAMPIVQTYSQEAALHDLPVIRKLIRTFASFDAKLEQTNYFGSEDLKSRTHGLLQAIYRIESAIKTKAYSNREHKRNPSAISLALASRLKTALAKALNKK